MAAPILTQARLRELLHYDPETGAFMWRTTGYGRPPLGAEAGTIDKQSGYRCICVGGRKYAHRLAFMYMTGNWPRHLVDHINGNRADNRWCNLRDMPRIINQQNRRSASSGSASGLLGAHKKRDRWSSQIKAKGVMHKLGVFATAEEAHAAYVEAKRRLHAGCTI